MRLALSLILTAGLLAVIPPPPASAQTVECAGVEATIVGTAGPDVLVGTPGRDVIVGGDGNDTINGKGRNDLICGGIGNDVIDGGSGADVIYGERGHDDISGERGNDTLRGGKGNDRLNGEMGDDRLFGGEDANRARGGEGADRCWDSYFTQSCLLGVDLELVASLPGGHRAGLAVSPPGDARLFLIDQAGPIRVIGPSGLETTPLITLAGRISTAYEQGVLGLAFHPDYATNGRFFVFSTQPDHDIVIEQFTDTGTWPIDPTSGTTIIEIDHDSSATNHNGGMVEFGPDGYLYAAIGDGGTGGANGQSLTTLLGKIIRLDVDSGSPYVVPADNPFVGVAGADEIWAYGLRNPWRFAFDPPEGRLYIGDVGQGLREEIDAVDDDIAGVNYGWTILEGTSCHSPSSGCDPSGTTLPILEEFHDDDAGTCSIIGGFVYRGELLPELTGHYFYGDYCAGYVRTFLFDGATVGSEAEWMDLGVNLTSFGIDRDGELYLATTGGKLYRLVPIR